MENYLFEIQEDQQMRLDKYLAEQFPEQTRSYLQKLIKEGAVLVNGKSVKTGFQLSKGDEVSVLHLEKETHLFEKIIDSVPSLATKFTTLFSDMTEIKKI